MRIRYLLPLMLLIGIVAIFRIHHTDQASLYKTKSVSQGNAKQEAWINVFIHGSFGTALGLLSMPKVLEDNVRGSLYREANKRIRDDQFFYKDQAILERGLVKVTPSFDRQVCHNRLFAAYPLTKAFETVAQWVEQSVRHKAVDVKQYFYTFGWTGLLSQTSRRFEAIRLYNALVEELERYHEQGIYPKIRLITHSHAGNLSLNLAAVQAVLHLDRIDDASSDSAVSDCKDAACHMLKLMRPLSSREEALSHKGQKKWDYVPTSKNLVIDQLVMYGCPIQPETIGFICSPMFKQIVNFYSGEDVIQRSDWVTTHRGFSDQRIGNYLFDEASWMQAQKKIHQVRLMIGRRWSKGSDGQKNSAGLSVDASEKKDMSLWDFLFAGQKAFARQSQDPTHKELWYCSWQKDAMCNGILAPLPLMVLTPLFMALVDDACDNRDLDINLKLSLDYLKVYIAQHNQEYIKSKHYMPRSLVEGLKAKACEWRPGEITLADEFNAVYKHLL